MRPPGVRNEPAHSIACSEKWSEFACQSVPTGRHGAAIAELPDNLMHDFPCKHPRNVCMSASSHSMIESPMSDLLFRPNGEFGKVHDVDPVKAGWQYVGFSLYRMRQGETASGQSGDTEIIFVVVEGKVELSDDRTCFGVLGDRMNVFEKTPPHALYVAPPANWNARAVTDCTLAVCTAPGSGGRQNQIVGPGGIEPVTRGKGTNTRLIFNIAMEDRDVADSLLVTEVFTPQGHWSSYPPHRHDEDDFPRITYLEETYYHRMNPAQGFGFQRVFTDDSSLDETICVHDHDVVLVPRGHHPCGAPFGYEMYYLNVMAGPVRKWRFESHPDHEWLYGFEP